MGEVRCDAVAMQWQEDLDADGCGNRSNDVWLRFMSSPLYVLYVGGSGWPKIQIAEKFPPGCLIAIFLTRANGCISSCCPKPLSSFTTIACTTRSLWIIT
jgi:hypothetical protein